jgi:organic radical activating enzyme
MFVRLAGCPLACTWCDTPYSWDWSRFDRRVETRRVGIDEVVSWAAGARPAADLVVVTGGEPLLQQGPLAGLAGCLADAGCRVEVETSGAVMPRPGVVAAVDLLVVSPKLAHSGMPAARRIRPEALTAFARSGKAVFKFVVQRPADLGEVAELEKQFHLAPVWIMPEGGDAQRILRVMREVADPVLDHGWHLSGRLHVLAWGDQRGR